VAALSRESCWRPRSTIGRFTGGQAGLCLSDLAIRGERRRTLTMCLARRRRSTPNLHQLLGRRQRRVVAVERLDHQLEAAVVERRSRRGLDGDQPFAEPTCGKVARAKRAIRVVAGAPHDGVRCKRTAGLADVAERTRGAEAPTIGDGAGPRERQLRSLPQLAQRRLTNVAADVRVGLQRRTPLDGTVGLDAHREAAGDAALEVVQLVALGRAQEPFFGPEVAQVVGREHGDAVGVRARLELGEARKQVEQVVRLQEHVGPVGAAPERHRQLHLPRGDAGVAQVQVQRLELAAVDAIDVGVGRDRDAGGAQVAKRRGGAREAAFAGAQQVVGGADAVDADRHQREAGGGHRLRHLGGHAAAASGHAWPDARGLERPRDVEVAVVQVGLATDEDDLAAAHRGELRDHGERLGGGEFVGARVAGARAAMGARLIARQRELPHHVAWVVLLGEDVETADAHGAATGRRRESRGRRRARAARRRSRARNDPGHLGPRPRPAPAAGHRSRGRDSRTRSPGCRWPALGSRRATRRRS
jgi:hypothetical protein